MVPVLGAAATWKAVGIGLGVAAAATMLATGGALLLIAGGQRLACPGAFQFIGSLPLAASPLALGAGLFVLLTRLGGSLEMGLGLVALINGLMGMPYVMRVWAPVAPDRWTSPAPARRPGHGAGGGAFARRSRRHCAVRHAGDGDAAAAHLSAIGHLSSRRCGGHFPVAHGAHVRLLRPDRTPGRRAGPWLKGPSCWK